MAAEKDQRYNLKPSSAIPPGKHTPAPSSYTSTYKEDFNKAAYDFWREHKLGSYYNVGYNLGKIGSMDITLDNFLDKIFFAIKEIIGQELRSNQQTSEFLKHKYNILNDILKIISQEISAKIDINTEVLYILLHGYMNGWMELVTEQKTREASYDE